MTSFNTLDDVTLTNKKCLVRVDINVPLIDDKVSDKTRIERIKPTVDDIVANGGKVILLAHFGRPKGQFVPDLSLRPIAEACSEVFCQTVSFCNESIGENAEKAVAAMKNGKILLLENTRFYEGEEKNDPDFAKSLAKLGDIFVADAFSASHRAHASTVGIANYLPTICGRTMQQELEALEKALTSPARPVVAVVGGAKVSTKIDLLENLVSRVDSLIIGGGMANTFLAAQGINVGKSLCEHDLASTAIKIMKAAEKAECNIILPIDVVVAKDFKANTENQTISVENVPEDTMILDAGPKTVEAIKRTIDRAKTLVWNGPLGAFELTPFDKTTITAAQHAAAQTKSGKLMSIAGGGDTVAALNHAGVAEDFTYVSTAGGAFLEWLEGKRLPGVEILKN